MDLSCKTSQMIFWLLCIGPALVQHPLNTSAFFQTVKHWLFHWLQGQFIPSVQVHAPSRNVCQRVQTVNIDFSDGVLQERREKKV